MPLYGHELSEAIDPFQAGLGFAVQFKGRDFIGAAALKELKSRADAPQRIGLEMASKRVPREHYPQFSPMAKPSARLQAEHFHQRLSDRSQWLMFSQLRQKWGPN